MHLILPVAGSSSRFPDMKPKWLLTHPRGHMMVLEAIKNLPLEEFDSINLICLQEHEEAYSVRAAIEAQFEEIGYCDKLSFVMLKERTKNQPETVYQGIKQGGITGPIFIKDSDNQFSAPVSEGNYVCYLDLHELESVNARNKSYIEIDEYNHINNIVEKKIVSSTFCVGGYAFGSAELFSEMFEQLNDGTPNLYISHLIYQLLLDGHAVKALHAEDYHDWGTIREWNQYKALYSTLFVDLDGTLVKNSGQYSSPCWGETDGIKQNIKALQDLHKSGKVQIIITTSRKESFRDVTISQMERLNIPYDDIIFGLVHGRRIVINDYARTNPFKSCDAINIKRNSEDLKDMLEESIGFHINAQDT
ncbi:hypothetical protein HLV39_14525 [Marinobacter adhaerens]|uniref:Uncharacterized protein n=1 Tax=Marinobacter adhaerens TaxID=1033846 RepID=A0A851HSN6_9GAMM|nr:hypothetical protein [Marinobacter adhaerens]NWN92709.1 hypothetical protein [Marinobacter adhaerens]